MELAVQCGLQLMDEPLIAYTIDPYGAVPRAVAPVYPSDPQTWDPWNQPASTRP